jgi:hypothetical protein
MYSTFQSKKRKAKRKDYIMKKKLITNPPKPNPNCCKTCLVRPCCSIEDWSDCPDAWEEIMKVGSFFYWPITHMTKREGLIEEGYSDEDAELLSSISGILEDVRKGKLTIRPATNRDRNVVKFVITEY